MNKKTKTDDKIKNDNLINAASKIGIAGKARNPESVFSTPKDLTYVQLDNIYLGDGFGKKIVDVYANTMTREWFKISGDPDGLLLNYTDIIKTKLSFNEALKWSRLYGASIIVMLIDDGGNLEDPVKVNSIRSVEGLRVIDRTQLSVATQDDLYTDPKDKKYGTIEVYTISPPQNTKVKKGISALASTQYKVHESRILRFDGEIAPARLMIENGYFGFSVLISVYTYLRNLAQSYEVSSEILHDYVISVISIKNLSNILSRPDGEAKVKMRAEIINYCKSVINGVIIDADGEQFDKITTSLSGLPDLIDRFGLALAAVAGIPYMVLMGDSPSGLNASGDGDLRSWYDLIANEQHEIMTVQLNKLLSYILASSDNPLKGKTLDDLEIVYNPLWQIDDAVMTDMRNKQAQTDQIYLQNGVAMPEEIGVSRFGGDSYSFETTIDTTRISAEFEDPEPKEPEETPPPPPEEEEETPDDDTE